MLALNGGIDVPERNNIARMAACDGGNDGQVSLNPHTPPHTHAHTHTAPLHTHAHTLAPAWLRGDRATLRVPAPHPPPATTPHGRFSCRLPKHTGHPTYTFTPLPRTVATAPELPLPSTAYLPSTGLPHGLMWHLLASTACLTIVGSILAVVRCIPSARQPGYRYPGSDADLATCLSLLPHPCCAVRAGATRALFSVPWGVLSRERRRRGFNRASSKHDARGTPFWRLEQLSHLPPPIHLQHITTVCHELLLWYGA